MTAHDIKTSSVTRNRQRAGAALIGGLALVATLTLFASEAAAQTDTRAEGLATPSQLASYLELSPRQEAMIRELHRQMQLDLADEYGQARRLQAQMRHLWQLSRYNHRAVLEIHQQLRAVRETIAARQALFQSQVTRILTPAQRTRFVHLRSLSSLLNAAPPAPAPPAFNNLRRLMPTSSPVNL